MVERLLINIYLFNFTRPVMTNEVIFLKEHILRLQEELSKFINIQLLPNKDYLFDQKILDPLIALYDHKIKEQAHIIKIYEKESREIKDSIKSMDVRRSDSANDINHLQVIQLEQQVEHLEQENEELSMYLNDAESTLQAASEKLDVYQHGIEEVTTKYKTCVLDFQNYVQRANEVTKEAEAKYKRIVKEKEDKIIYLENVLTKTERIICDTKKSAIEISKKCDDSDCRYRELIFKEKEQLKESQKIQDENMKLTTKAKQYENENKILLESLNKKSEKASIDAINFSKTYEEKVLKLDFTLQETQMKLSQVIKNKEDEIIQLNNNLQKIMTENRDLQHHIQKIMDEPSQNDNYEMIIHNLNLRLREVELSKSRAEEDYTDMKKCSQDSEEKFLKEKRLLVEQINLLESHLSAAILERDKKRNILKSTEADFDNLQVRYSKLKAQMEQENIESVEKAKQLSRTLDTSQAEFDVIVKDLELKNQNLLSLNTKLEAEHSKLQTLYSAKNNRNCENYEKVIESLKEALKAFCLKYDSCSKRLTDISNINLQYEKELKETQGMYRRAQESVIELRGFSRKQQEIIQKNLKKLDSVMEERRIALSKIDQLQLKISRTVDDPK
eukprot:NODE_660_length_5439_cov_0.338577.p1 type:complete len:616 gc:universal NODE_660_length_5439_cov_0.338577:3076-1229(-)